MSECVPVINYSDDTRPQGNITIKPFNRTINHPTPHLFTPHRGEFNKLLWIEKGKGFLNIDFTKYQLEDNQLFLISQEPVFYFEDKSEIKGYLILFKNEIVPQVDMFLNVQIQLNVDKKKNLKEVVDKLLFLINYEAEHLDNNNRFSVFHYYLGAIIQIMIHEHKLNCDKISPLSNLYVRFLEKILMHGNQFFTVSEYAGMLNISEETLFKDIKIISGKSPKKIIDHYILLEAKRQLSFELLSIKEIAHNLGFKYSSYFNRFFKNKTGMTPIEFRKMHSCIYIVS